MRVLPRLHAVLIVIAFVCSTSGAAKPDTYREQAQQILGTAGVKGGLIVHVGCGDGKLTAALRASDSFLVHGLDRDVEAVQKLVGTFSPLASTGRLPWTTSTAGHCLTWITS